MTQISMDIHIQNRETETQNTTNFDDDSNKMFKLIKWNRAKDLLELFQGMQRDQLYNLVNKPNKKYNNALPINHAICCSSSHLIFIMLLRLGARFDFVTDHPSPSPLFMAVRSGQMNLVKILLLSGADVNALDEEGYSILHWACFSKNTLMIRLILKLTNFTFHNHDRNTKRITPLSKRSKAKIFFHSKSVLFLGIAVELDNLEMVKELLKSDHVDPNVIDSKTHRYLYDLAAESDQYHTCIELELAFKHQNISKYTCKRSIKRHFHDLHEFTVEAVIQHQLRSKWLKFADDPRGAFQPLDDPTLRLPVLPHSDNWKVIKQDGSIDLKDGWTYSFVCGGSSDNPLVITYSGSEVVEEGGLFNYFDNYRYRLLARIHKNNKKPK